MGSGERGITHDPGIPFATLDPDLDLFLLNLSHYVEMPVLPNGTKPLRSEEPNFRVSEKKKMFVSNEAPYSTLLNDKAFLRICSSPKAPSASHADGTLWQSRNDRKKWMI
ncbi:hypothetical protein NQ318_021511 [Aromia moschata]|uniref:Uncharacterized protein n=1 Tax=Aromia moschata TaxID=1265417 RepID=A0AAV8ZD73_9CUCU|nr:hypothetical protein NQ318_021511 [Aromia moschata]